MERLRKFELTITMEVEAQYEEDVRDLALEVVDAHSNGESTIHIDPIDETNPLTDSAHNLHKL